MMTVKEKIVFPWEKTRWGVRQQYLAGFARRLEADVFTFWRFCGCLEGEVRLQSGMAAGEAGKFCAVGRLPRKGNGVQCELPLSSFNIFSFSFSFTWNSENALPGRFASERDPQILAVRVPQRRPAMA